MSIKRLTPTLPLPKPFPAFSRLLAVELSISSAISASRPSHTLALPGRTMAPADQPLLEQPSFYDRDFLFLRCLNDDHPFRDGSDPTSDQLSGTADSLLVPRDANGLPAVDRFSDVAHSPPNLSTLDIYELLHVRPDFVIGRDQPFEKVQSMLLLKGLPRGSGAHAAPPGPVKVDGHEEWVVERIMGHEDRKNRGKVVRWYHIRWEGYQPKDDTMEPRYNLVRHARKMVDVYEARNENTEAKVRAQRRPGLRPRRAKPRNLFR